MGPTKAQMEELNAVNLQADFTCSKCGQVKPVNRNGGTGYGTDPETGAVICYACIGPVDLERALLTGKFFGYLNGPDWKAAPGAGHSFKVTNWPGSLEVTGRHASRSRHNIGRWRVDVWFKFPGDPFVWHGVQIGEYNSILRAKRTKKKEF